MTIIRTGLFVFAFLFCSTLAFGQQKYPSTLLWKISGKDLTRPSYLYGTMHLQDRRLFYFGDSLYTALEKTEGFAMEINPDEMMDSIFKAIGKEDTSALLKKILTEAEFKKIAKKLEKKFKIPADKITTKKLAEEKKKMNELFNKKDDMPTIMDLYLFSIARKQGKHTSGIEDLADQFDISDEIGKFNVNDFIKDDSTMRISYLENMLQIYTNKDLTTLNAMVNNDFNSNYKDLLLIKRNKKMAVRMDSLSHVRTTFFAVGAAHLPGDSGVITLLRQLGYSVEPVFSTKNIAPEDYKYTFRELPWLKVEDENKMCSVEMPGSPSDVLIQETLPVKMYIDLGDLSVYGIAVTPLSEAEAKSDSVFDHLIDNFRKSEFDIKNIKKISYKNCNGIEMYAVQEGTGEYRYRMLIRGNKLFIVIFGAKNKNNLYGVNAEKFMNSLSFNEENIEGTNKWQLFTNERNAFSMMTPGKTIEARPKDEEGIEYDQYTSVDYSDGTYYMVVIRDTRPGYYVENDSLYFEEYKRNMESLKVYEIKEFSTQKFKNYNACHFVALQKINDSEILLEGYLIRRGGRTYIPMAIMPKEKADFPAITNFFRSFTPLPFKTTGWKKQELGETNISTYAPGIFIKEIPETTAYNFDQHIQKYYVQDINTAKTYSVEIETLSPYYWSNSDSAFFKNRAESFKAYNDSIISWKYINGPVKEAVVLIQKSDSEILKKLRFFLNGDTLYTFYTFQNENELNEPLVKQYFSEIQFPHQYRSTIFENKAVQLLDALNCADSAVVADARDVMNAVEFTKNELPLLYKAFQKKYKTYENNYQTINDLIANKITDLNDSSVVDFVDKNYKIKNDSIQDNQMLMLEMLAKQKTVSAYKLLKQLILNYTPQSGTIYSVINVAADTFNLIKDIFPSATALYADTVIGGGIAKWANNLLDSNMVSAADVLQNEKGLINLATKQYAEIKKDKEAYPVYNTEVIALLGKFNTVQSNATLNKFLSLPDMWVKNNAILALLKNNIPVSASEIKKYAVDKEWRTTFYESLKEIKRTSVFPKEFYSQTKFAESYLYYSLLEDYEVDVKSMQLVKEKTAEIKGKMHRFYIYKVILNDDDKTSRFAVCGAFDMDKNIAEIKDEDLDVYLNYEEEPAILTTDEFFKKYLEEKIKYSKND